MFELSLGANGEWQHWPCILWEEILKSTTNMNKVFKD
jgi:hypothetical protein